MDLISVEVKVRYYVFLSLSEHAWFRQQNKDMRIL